MRDPAPTRTAIGGTAVFPCAVCGQPHMRGFACQQAQVPSTQTTRPVLKWVWRYDPSNTLLRVCRVMWTRGVVGDGNGYSTKLSVGLRPTLFRWRRESSGWLPTVAGVRVHLDRSYGGIHV